MSVNPEILVWARQSAGLTVEEAASASGLSNSASSTAADKLSAMEAGEKQPTRNQLNTFARLYKRPLVTFYLSSPPKKGQRGQDFRQTPEARGTRANAMLDALLRDVKARQEMVRDILVDEDDFTPPDFVGTARINDTVKGISGRIAGRLGFDHTNLALRRGGPADLFTRLRQAAEAIGVFVLVLGDLGSHHTAIPASVFRGFAIADPVAPFIVINARDASPARAFTLIHELAHIWLGQTGVSGDLSTTVPNSENARIERFCNDVASEFLLPEQYFRNGAANFEPEDVDAARACIESIASRWSVSEPMVAYRFLRRGELATGAYEALRMDYHRKWQAKVARDRNSEGGPSGHVIRRYKLGNALVDVVHRGLREKSITHTKAAILLGSKAVSVPAFLAFIESSRRADKTGIMAQS